MVKKPLRCPIYGSQVHIVHQRFHHGCRVCADNGGMTSVLGVKRRTPARFERASQRGLLLACNLPRSLPCRHSSVSRFFLLHFSKTSGEPHCNHIAFLGTHTRLHWGRTPKLSLANRVGLTHIEDASRGFAQRSPLHNLWLESLVSFFLVRRTTSHSAVSDVSISSVTVRTESVTWIYSRKAVVSLDFESALIA